MQFLRGCGLPETLIDYIPSLIGKPFEFYSCFISYSTKDKLFADRLYADLQNNGLRVWIFHEDAKWGGIVWGEIDGAIRLYDRLIVICSENSLQSVPVNREIERSLQKEDREGKHVLFPVTIDDYLFDEWEHERRADVLATVVGDFRSWEKPAQYKKALQRLLDGLKAE